MSGTSLSLPSHSTPLLPPLDVCNVLCREFFIPMPAQQTYPYRLLYLLAPGEGTVRAPLLSSVLHRVTEVSCPQQHFEATLLSEEALATRTGALVLGKAQCYFLGKQ